MKKWNRALYERDTLVVARDLIGKTLCYKKFQGTILETEAYLPCNDPASHAAKGKTERNAMMFGPAGFTYIYFIYGMYHCLNFVTEKEGSPAAVLIRAVKFESVLPSRTNGPGKLCRYLDITRVQNGIDLCKSSDFFVKESGLQIDSVATPRIGISDGQTLPYRFVATSQDGKKMVES